MDLELIKKCLSFLVEDVSSTKKPQIKSYLNWRICWKIRYGINIFDLKFYRVCCLIVLIKKTIINYTGENKKIKR